MLFWISLSAGSAALAASQARNANPIAFDIPAAVAAEALKRFSTQSGIEVIIEAELGRTVRTKDVRGEMLPRDAIHRMLAGTGLEVVEAQKYGALSVKRTGSVPSRTGSAQSTGNPHPPADEPTGAGDGQSRLLGRASAATRSAPRDSGSRSDSPDARADRDRGAVTGFVSNAATGNLLEGARVEIPALGLATLTDITGRFNFTQVPPGAHVIVAAYTGLDSEQAEIAVAAGTRAVRNFDLTAGVYQLAEFKVTGQREGAAAAITAQRNADNVKNVVAMDSFGTLPNMSASEVALQLPGIGAQLNEAGLVSGLTVRGMDPTLNTITMDGVLLTGRDTALNRENNLYV